MEHNYDRELGDIMSKYEIRIIEPRDFHWCVEVASVRMLEEEVKRPDLVDKVSLYMIVNKMYMDKTAIVGLVDGEYAGAIGGYLHPNIFNPNIATMAELMWYVLPEYRRSRIGAMLLKKYDEVASQSPAKDATLSLLANSPIRDESLEKLGFKLEEKAYRKFYKE